MENQKAKIGLYFNNSENHYELKVMASNYNEYDPNLKWVFDHTKYELAVKIQHCMNLSDKY